jgi:serine/threonine protein kinase
MIEQVGKYKVIRLIGEGGMSAVYEAEHEMLGNKVAIKVLNPILSSNEQIRTRFKNEAKLMATLNHPNITKVIDFDDQPQQLSIIMEFLEGEDLSERIKKHGSPSDAEIGNIFNQTLSAFDYAHQKGIVHRDIKPSNIFLLPNGSVKVLDFGIAKLYAENQEMTQTGTQMGTPIYMSPEQVKADKTIDLRSDIYSLGVTLFFTVNGKPPYDGSNTSQFDIFNKIVFEPLPSLDKKSVFESIISKACSKEREGRFQNCSEFAEALNNPSKQKQQMREEKTIIEASNNADKTMIDASRANTGPIIEVNPTDVPPPKTSVDNPQKNETTSQQPKNNGNSNQNIYLILAIIILVLGCLGLFFIQEKIIKKADLEFEKTEDGVDFLDGKGDYEDGKGDYEDGDGGYEGGDGGYEGEEGGYEGGEGGYEGGEGGYEGGEGGYEGGEGGYEGEEGGYEDGDEGYGGGDEGYEGGEYE